jgi:hypothetical protein
MVAAFAEKGKTVNANSADNIFLGLFVFICKYVLIIPREVNNLSI